MLESAHLRYLKKILRVPWTDGKSYEEIIKMADNMGCKIMPIEGKLRSARLRYLGHVERREDVGWLTKMCLYGTVEGSLVKGRPCKNFRQCVADDWKWFGINSKVWKNNICESGKGLVAY